MQSCCIHFSTPHPLASFEPSDELRNPLLLSRNALDLPSLSSRTFIIIMSVGLRCVGGVSVIERVQNENSTPNYYVHSTILRTEQTPTILNMLDLLIFVLNLVLDFSLHKHTEMFERILGFSRCSNCLRFRRRR